MPDPEAVASRLQKFIQAADKKSTAMGVQPKYSMTIPATAPKDRILAIYEECLGQLTHEERDRLDDVLTKMLRQLNG